MTLTGKFDHEVEKTQAVENLLLSGGEYKASSFTPAYIDAVFAQWYSMGKPPMTRFLKAVIDPVDYGITCGRPSATTLNSWRDEFFNERATALDEQVSRQLSERLISEKVAMLNAHAAVASEMQAQALEYLRSNPDKMNPQTAVRMLVEGVRIERESRGIPRTLEKLAEKSDDDLMKQIEDLLLRTPVNYEQLEDGD